METVKNHFFSDMGVMLGRSMRHIFRSMDTIITVCITPIAAQSTPERITM
jgi:ABC-2 type transport system permease protein